MTAGPMAAQHPVTPEPAPEPKKRSMSLFGLVTGIGGRRREETPAPAPVTPPAPQATAPVYAPPPAPSAPRLETAAPRSQTDEDMLDIPAFLRRQAD